jgi:hypothetical protein
MNWTTHTPAFDGDAPDGVTLVTHDVEIQNMYFGWSAIHHDLQWVVRAHGMPATYRYRPRYETIMAELAALRVAINPPACMESIKE